ncbi:hypothetical protein ACFQX7_30925 [Luedemannella flava]
MVLGIILLPDDATSKRISTYSDRLAQSGEATMRLGDGAPPHVTLLHAEFQKENGAEWWDALQSRIPTDISCSLAGLLFQEIPTGDYYVPEEECPQALRSCERR